MVWAAARGVADLAAGRPIETATTFPIASVTKQFTATVVLLLAHEGRLSLDDPLSTWVPGLPPWSDSVTVAQAMHMVSGIPDYVDLRARAGTAETEPRNGASSAPVITAVSCGSPVALSGEPAHCGER